MLKEKLQKRIKSHVLLQSQQKERLLLVLESASEKDLESLEQILNSLNKKFISVLDHSLNAENTEQVILKFKNLKKQVDRMEESAELEREELMQEDLLSKIDQE